MSLTINYAKKKSDYYWSYIGQVREQDCGIEIDPEKKTLGIFSNDDFNNIFPIKVHHRRLFWFPFHYPSALEVKDVNAFINMIAPLAEKIIAGYKSEWNGDNLEGTLTKDAKEAYIEVLKIMRPIAWMDHIPPWIDNPYIDYSFASLEETDYDNWW